VNPSQEPSRNRPRRHPVPDDALVQERLLRLIGLGVRSRGAVVGVEQVRTAVKGGKLALVVVAADASRHSLDKLVPLLEARGVNFLDFPSAVRLGMAVGREQTAAVGIIDRSLAKGIRDLVRVGPQQAPQEGV
jgi:ribosomal protein L7Ae-like RNA K-turn-binding protein